MAHFLALLFRYWHQQSSDKGCTQYAGNAEKSNYILNKLPSLHERRPRGSKPMIDVAGARARLCGVRPGAWLISPFTGWKWAKWPNGEVGWLPNEIELPASLKVSARNDLQ
jgi:hypothetical protein